MGSVAALESGVAPVDETKIEIETKIETKIKTRIEIEIEIEIDIEIKKESVRDQLTRKMIVVAKREVVSGIRRLRLRTGQWFPQFLALCKAVRQAPQLVLKR